MQFSLEVGDRTRTAEIVGAPGSPDPRALVLVFHGSKQDGATHRRFTGGALDRLAEEGRAVVAYLDGVGGNWNDARAESGFRARLEQVDDVAFARAVIDELAGSHGIDRRAVVGAGYSNGGQMVLKLLHEREPLLAGAVVVAATMPDRAGFLGEYSESSDRSLPVALVAGTADRIVPFGGGRMAWWARTLFKVGGTALSASATAEYLAQRNGIGALPSTRTLPARRGDRTSTEVTTYREPGRASVVLYAVHGGGHTVPGASPAPAVLGRTGSDRSIDEIVDEVLREVASARRA